VTVLESLALFFSFLAAILLEIQTNITVTTLISCVFLLYVSFKDGGGTAKTQSRSIINAQSKILVFRPNFGGGFRGQA